MPNKTKIEWVKNLDGTQGYTINPVKGLCPVACPYCYARAMYKRFEWNPEIRCDLYCMVGLPSKPSRIFVGSTMELFGDWVPEYWLSMIFVMTQKWKQHTFFFLTKQPQNLIKWSPFPENCWIGVSCTNFQMYGEALFYLADIKANVKFLSFEPLLAAIRPSPPYSGYDERAMTFDLKTQNIGWLIIGQQTPISVKTQPKIEWIQEIVEAAEKAGIAVFLKDNLESLIPFVEWDDYKSEGALRTRSGKLRQEFPK